LTPKHLFPDAVITGELLEHLRLPEDFRYELVEGRIEPVVSPTNVEHAEAVGRISALLRASMMPGWKILTGDVGIYVRRKPDTIRGADVAAISHARFATRDHERAMLTVVPELVVEIISPSNTADDTALKVREYLAAGADAVWVVDLDAQRVSVSDKHRVTTHQSEGQLWLPNGATLTVAQVLHEA